MVYLLCQRYIVCFFGRRQKVGSIACLGAGPAGIYLSAVSLRRNKHAGLPPLVLLPDGGLTCQNGRLVLVPARLRLRDCPHGQGRQPGLDVGLAPAQTGGTRQSYRRRDGLAVAFQSHVNAIDGGSQQYGEFSSSKQSVHGELLGFAARYHATGRASSAPFGPEMYLPRISAGSLPPLLTEVGRMLLRRKHLHAALAQPLLDVLLEEKHLARR